ncbi:MAG: glycosyltransferase [Microvirga sp.]
MSGHPSVVVAIPVKNEANCIAACLQALSAQCDESGGPMPRDRFGVVLALNNCSDGTAEIVRSIQDSLPFTMWLLERDLAPEMAHAGGARKIAMDAAADLAASSDRAEAGVILTTDADGRVGPRWIAANLAAIDAGVDLVAGFVQADPHEHALLPAALIERGRLESRYEWLLAELIARLDPDRVDPWPNHRAESGASLAITLDAYRRVGGVSAIPTGEDRALAASVRLAGGRVRHSLAAQVLVSCRLDGRAAAGMAATIKQRILEPDLACDSALEPADRVWLRGRLRAVLRHRHRQGRFGLAAPWVAKLGLDLAEADGITETGQFIATWAALERASPALAYRPLTPRQLPGQIAAAEAILRKLRAKPVRRRPTEYVDPILLRTGLKHDLRNSAGGIDEALRHLVAAQGIVGPASPVDEDDIPARGHGLRGELGHELEIAGAPVVRDLR